MLKKRILASSMASVLALSSVSVTAFADETNAKDYGEAATKAELKEYLKSLEKFMDGEIDKYGTNQAEQIRDAYTHAQVVLDNENSTDDDAAFAYQMLKSLYDAKIIKTSTELAALIKDCKPTYDRNNVLNEDSDINDLIYTQESFLEFTNAYEAAEYATDSDESREITDAYLDLKEEFDSLKPNDIVTKADFRSVITQYQDLADKQRKYESTKRGTITVAPKTGSKGDMWDKDKSKKQGQHLVDDDVIITYGDLYDMIYEESETVLQFWNSGWYYLNDGVAEGKIEKNTDCVNKNSHKQGHWIGADAVYAGGKSRLQDGITAQYDRLVAASNVTKTTDDNIVAAYKAAKEAIDVFNSWTPDKLNTSSAAGVNKTINGFHNQLVEVFNYNIFNQLFFPTDLTKIESYKNLSSYKGTKSLEAEVTTQGQVDDKDYKIELKYDYSKHTITTNKNFAVIINKATKQMYIPMGANITSWMFSNADYAAEAIDTIPDSDKVDEYGRTIEFDTQKVIAKSDFLQWVCFDEDAASTMSYSNILTKRITALNKEMGSAKIIATVPAYADVDDSKGDDGELVIPAAYQNVINKRTSVAATPITDKVLSYLKPKANATDDQKDAIKEHNTQLGKVKTAFDNFKSALKNDVSTADITAVKDSLKAIYEAAADTVGSGVATKFATEAAQGATNYNVYNKTSSESTTLRDYKEVTATPDGYAISSVTIASATDSAIGVSGVTGGHTLKMIEMNSGTATDAQKTVIKNHNDQIVKIDAANKNYGAITTLKTAWDTFAAVKVGTDDVEPWKGAVTFTAVTTAVPMDDTNKGDVTAIAGVNDGSNKRYTFEVPVAILKAVGVADADIVATSTNPNYVAATSSIKFTYYSVNDSGSDTTKQGNVQTYNAALDTFEKALKTYTTTVTDSANYKSTTDSLAALKTALEIGLAAGTAKNLVAEKALAALQADPLAASPNYPEEYTYGTGFTMDKDLADYVNGGGAAPAADVEFKTVTDDDDHNAVITLMKRSDDVYDTLVAASKNKPANPTKLNDPKVKAVINWINNAKDFTWYAEEKFDKDNGYYDLALDILQEAAAGGKEYSNVTGSGTEWGYINRKVYYALDNLLREKAPSTAHINDIKKEIATAKDLIDKTGDAALFDLEDAHNNVVVARQDAIDWVADANAKGWTVDYVNPRTGTDTEKALKAIKDANKVLKNWYDSFTTSYGDIAAKIVEIGKALDDGTVTSEDLKKQLNKVAIEISTLKNSDITLDGSDADSNLAFNTDREFQKVNRLKNARKDAAVIAELSDDEEDLVKDYKKLVELWDKAKNPTSDVPGDVDGDGKFLLADVTSMISKYMSGEAVDAKANKAWDMDNDEKFTLADVTAAIAKYMG